MSDSYFFTVANTQWTASRLAREYVHPQNYDTNKTLMPRADYFLHKHSDYELHYIFQGSCTFSIGTKSFSVQQGEYILISPNVYHCIKQVSSDISKMCISLSFALSSKIKLSPESEELVSCFSKFDVFTSPLIEQSWLFSSICKQPKEKSCPFYETEEMKAYLTLLVIHVSKQLKEQNPHISPSIKITPKQNTEIVEFFNVNFRLQNGADILSQQLHISRRHLDRILKKQYGKNYREMLHEARLEKALDLLTSSKKSIAEIAKLIGYSNTAGFITFIKNQTGFTPLQLRKVSKNSF